MEKTKKKMYEIVGRTTAGNFACSGFCSELRIAIDFFIEKYPRFKGEALIKTQFADDIGDGVLVANAANWEIIDSFNSTKELKEYKGAN
jgi:hypothetical protein